MYRRVITRHDFNRLVHRALVGHRLSDASQNSRWLGTAFSGRMTLQNRLMFSTSRTRSSLASSHDSSNKDTTPAQKHLSTSSYNEKVTVHEQSHDDGQKTAQILISNAKKQNSLDTAVIQALTSAFNSISKTENLRCIVLRGEAHPSGAGKTPSFCAGVSLTEMLQLKNSQEATDLISRISTLNRAVQNCPVPVIAAVDGHCYGGGVELAASCDRRYATKISKFAMPEVRVGVPSVVQARLLVDLMGPSRAKYFMLFGNTIDAAEAYRQGLVDEVFETVEDMDAHIEKDMHDLMFKCGPNVVRVQKELFKTWDGLNVEDGIDASVESFARMWEDGGLQPRRYMNMTLEEMKKKNKAKK